MITICSVGFGEAAQAFSSGWRSAPADVAAFDIKTQDAVARDAKLADYVSRGVLGVDTLVDALFGREAAFSLVTADQALAAAQQAAEHDLQSLLWFDCNSCAPDTKRRAAGLVEQASGRYVDVAVMAPVYPKRHEVPLLVSGPHAEVGATVLSKLGMRPMVVGEEVGQASTIKMLRSVMIKGTEALFAECFLAAQKAGVLDNVVGSLAGSNPNIEWTTQGSYTLERMLVHGGRRAAEMREVAKTLSDLGLPAGLSEATVHWQERLGALAVEPGEDALVDRLNRVLNGL
ncbi:MAG: DUF1932 domain-containing protein [Pseudomonadota bacterium]